MLGNKLVLASPIIFHFFFNPQSKNCGIIFLLSGKYESPLPFQFLFAYSNGRFLFLTPLRPLRAKCKLIKGKKWGNGQSQFLMFSIVKEKILHEESKEHLMIQGHGKVPKIPDLKQLSEAYSAKLQGTRWIRRKEEKHGLLYSLCEAVTLYCVI